MHDCANLHLCLPREIGLHGQSKRTWQATSLFIEISQPGRGALVFTSCYNRENNLISKTSEKVCLKICTGKSVEDRTE